MTTAQAVPVAGEVYDLDRTHSTVQFAVRHGGIATFRGSFADIEAQLTVAAENVQLSAQAVVESISITEPDFRAHVVEGDDFFAAAQSPVITFRSTEVVLDEARAEVAGDLTIRGISQPVRANGRFSSPRVDPFGNTRLGLELEATIDRRQFGLTWQMPLPDGGDALGWEVSVDAQLEFTKRA
jgi:polyisoprenoid-binding protein YceI